MAEPYDPQAVSTLRRMAGVDQPSTSDRLALSTAQRVAALSELGAGRPVDPAALQQIDNQYKSISTEFADGLRRAGYSMGASVKATFGQLAENVAPEYGRQVMQSAVRDMENMPASLRPTYQTFDEAQNAGLRGLVQYGSGVLGEGLPSVGANVVGGLIGRGAFRALGRSGLTGQIAGGTLTSLPMESGETALELAQDPNSMNLSPAERTALMLGRGGINAALESVVPAMTTERIFGNVARTAAGFRPALANVGKASAQGALGEYGTEFAQDLTGQGALMYANPENKFDLAKANESGIRGAIVGGVLGGGGGAIQSGVDNIAAARDAAIKKAAEKMPDMPKAPSVDAVMGRFFEILDNPRQFGVDAGNTTLGAVEQIVKASSQAGDATAAGMDKVGDVVGAVKARLDDFIINNIAPEKRERYLDLTADLQNLGANEWQALKAGLESDSGVALSEALGMAANTASKKVASGASAVADWVGEVVGGFRDAVKKPAPGEKQSFVVKEFSKEEREGLLSDISKLSPQLNEMVKGLKVVNINDRRQFADQLLSAFNNRSYFEGPQTPEKQKLLDGWKQLTGTDLPQVFDAIRERQNTIAATKRGADREPGENSWDRFASVETEVKRGEVDLSLKEDGGAKQELGRSPFNLDAFRQSMVQERFKNNPDTGIEVALSSDDLTPSQIAQLIGKRVGKDQFANYRKGEVNDGEPLVVKVNPMSLSMMTKTADFRDAFAGDVDEYNSRVGVDRQAGDRFAAGVGTLVDRGIDVDLPDGRMARIKVSPRFNLGTDDSVGPNFPVVRDSTVLNRGRGQEPYTYGEFRGAKPRKDWPAQLRRLDRFKGDLSGAVATLRGEKDSPVSQQLIKVLNARAKQNNRSVGDELKAYYNELRIKQRTREQDNDLRYEREALREALMNEEMTREDAEAIVDYYRNTDVTSEETQRVKDLFKSLFDIDLSELAVNDPRRAKQAELIEEVIDGVEASAAKSEGILTGNEQTGGPTRNGPPSFVKDKADIREEEFITAKLSPLERANTSVLSRAVADAARSGKPITSYTKATTPEQSTILNTIAEAKTVLRLQQIGARVKQIADQLTNVALDNIRKAYAAKLSELKSTRIENVPMSYKMAADGVREDLRAQYPNGTTTMQLIKDGQRTATTRREFAKVGDIVTFQGDPTEYRVTAVEKPDLTTPEGRAKWEQREGWSLAYIDADPKLKAQVYSSNSVQTVFEPVKAPAKPVAPSKKEPEVASSDSSMRSSSTALGPSKQTLTDAQSAAPTADTAVVGERREGQPVSSRDLGGRRERQSLDNPQPAEPTAGAMSMDERIAALAKLDPFSKNDSDVLLGGLLDNTTEQQDRDLFEKLFVKQEAQRLLDDINGEGLYLEDEQAIVDAAKNYIEFQSKQGTLNFENKGDEPTAESKAAKEKFLKAVEKMVGKRIKVLFDQKLKDGVAATYTEMPTLDEVRSERRTMLFEKTKNTADRESGMSDEQIEQRIAELEQMEKNLLGDKAIRGLIRVATGREGQAGLAEHETIHGAFSFFFTPQEKSALGLAFSQGLVGKRLREYFKDQPQVLNVIDPKSENFDAEEAAAYGFQVWSLDPNALKLGERATTLFERFKEFFRKILGILTPEEKAALIFEDLKSGRRAEEGAASPLAKKLDKEQPWGERAQEFVRDIGGFLEKGYDYFLTGMYDRILKVENPQLTRIAKLAYEATGEEGQGGMIQKMRQRTRLWENRADKVFQGLSDEELLALHEAKIFNKPPTDPKLLQKYKEFNQLFDDLYQYQNRAGVVMNKVGIEGSYYPLTWDPDKVLKNKDAFLAMLAKYEDKLADAKKTPSEIWESITSYIERGEDLVNVMGKNGEPISEHSRTRTLGFISREDRRSFMTDDAKQNTVRYIKQAVRQAEYVRAFGMNGEKLAEMKNEARNTYGATADEVALVDDMIDGLLGNKEIGMSRELKDLYGGMTVYQNIRLLPFAIFNSLIDPLGIAVRSNSIGDAWGTFTYSMRNLFKGWKAEYTRDQWEMIAEDWGIIERAGTTLSTHNLYDGVTLRGTTKKINDAFFKYNLLNGWIRNNTIMAVNSAQRFMYRAAEGKFGEAASQRYLDELALSKDDIVYDATKGRILLRKEELMAAGKTEKEAAAIEGRLRIATDKFVRQALINPSAAELPGWASNPYLAPIAHLKNFVWGFNATITNRIYNELSYGNYKPAMLAAAYVPGMIAATFMKDMVNGFGEEPPYKKEWGITDYVMEGIAKSGLTGTGQFFMSAKEDIMRGGVGVEYALGPTFGQGRGLLQALQSDKDGAMWNWMVKSMPANAVYDNVLLN